MIALTMGAEGSRFYTDKGVYAAKAPDVKGFEYGRGRRQFSCRYNCGPGYEKIPF